jgi:gamma-glutamyltranspeptidase/glutathione hydrolase
MDSRRRDFLKYAGLAPAAQALSAQPASCEDSFSDTRFGRKKAVVAKNAMVICSSPLAAQAGLDIMKAGGNACDAACAVAAVQTVVDPHLTSITGCFCLLHYDARGGRTSYVNGSINAPKARLTGFSAADTRTGKGVGVPGWWGGFEAALSKLGSKPRALVMAPAIHYAREGFRIYPFLYGEMFSQLASIGVSPQGREIYMPQGALLSPGQVLKQERAARTLERLAAEGSDYFYRGEFAKRYCEVVRQHDGVMTAADFESYAVRWDEPARGSYRGFDIVASPPPDNGGTHIIEALNMIELIDLQKHGPPSESAETMRELILISNEVMSAGARQTDPHSHPVPLDLITSKEYARIRYKLLQMAGPLPASPPPPPGTTHVTVMDGAGNVVSLLHSSMAEPWQNGLFVEGVSICASGGHFLRVMPEPGDRASVFLAPNIIFKGGKPLLASGSPSASLVMCILQNLVNILDFKMPIEQSVHRPRFGAIRTPPGGNMIEADIDEKFRQKMLALGGVMLEPVSPWNYLNGSFEGIYIDPDTGSRIACGDPRRTSQAYGL